MSKKETRKGYVRVRLTPEEEDRLNLMSEEQRRSKSEIVRIGLDKVYQDSRSQ